MPDQFPVTDLNKVKRVPKNASYDCESIYSVIDAAWIALVGFTNPKENSTAVIPMFHARMDDNVVFHGATSSRLIKFLASGEPVCLTFAMVDGLVLAKSLFHHSMNYRSAVVYGSGTLVNDPEEITEAFKAISDKVMPGRWDDARQPIAKELAATAVVKVKIASASAKIRTGDPVDEPSDIDLPVWSGILPFQSKALAPVADSNSTEFPTPQYILDFAAKYNA